MLQITKSQIDTLKERISGQVLTARDDGYEEARSIWNGMVDRKPALIVQVVSADDVQEAVKFARKNNIEMSILGGGHHIAGNSLAEDGLTIDFSNMKNVRVDADRKRAFVEPGATLHDFDTATQAHGLTTPTGINSTTGIAGLTLGGGFGWLTRRFGLTIDNLISANIVTAEGKKIKAGKDENADLFWAIRGGGGNFGIVTEFEFQLHELKDDVFAGLIVFPFRQAKKVLQQYREFIRSAPESLNVWAVVRPAPPLPFLPKDVHGMPVVVLAVFYTGEPEKSENLVGYLRKFGKPIGEHLGRQPYVQWQQAFDPLLTPGARNYWKSHNFEIIKDDVIDFTIDYAHNFPSLQCEIFLGLISGAPNRIATNATAYQSRDAKVVMNVHARWENAEDDEKCITWARDFFKATLPYASGGAYVNFMTEEESDRVVKAYGPNYERLVQLKQRYDPENVFHMNHNIKPEPITK